MDLWPRWWCRGSAVHQWGHGWHALWQAPRQSTGQMVCPQETVPRQPLSLTMGTPSVPAGDIGSTTVPSRRRRQPSVRWRRLIKSAPGCTTGICMAPCQPIALPVLDVVHLVQGDPLLCGSDGEPNVGECLLFCPADQELPSHLLHHLRLKLVRSCIENVVNPD